MSGEFRKQLKRITQEAIERGWRVEEKTKGFCFKYTNGGMYHVHKTVSDCRAVMHIEKALRRIEEGRPAGAH